MIDPSLLLVDRTRLQQFTLLGRVRRLFADRPQIRWTDADGVPWAGVRIDGMGFAVSGLGPGWCFDPFICLQQAEKLAKRKQSLQQGAAAVTTLLDAAVGALHLGNRCERALWSIQRSIRRACRSVFLIPDASLACDVFGAREDDRPPNWRSELRKILRGLTFLHVAEWNGETHPPFGTDTALLTLAADLRGQPEDGCDQDCPLRGRQRHHHLQLNVGRGFLGMLERLADKDSGDGIRTYEFFRTSKKQGTTLRQVGQTGRLVSVFLPAVLGRPELCAGFSPRQRELLQSILREGTRVKANPDSDGKVKMDLELLKGNWLPNHCGKKWLQCPLLDENRRYNGFNGNKFRRGLGYLLTSPGGWMPKAGYRPSGSTFKTSDIRSFLDDLAVLSERLNLMVVGLDRHSESPWLGIEALRNLCSARGFQQILERLHLRFYAQVGWEERWKIFFEGSPEASQRPDLPELVSKLQQLPITQKQIATELNVNPSFLCKLLSGKKKWPETLLEQARSFLEQQRPASVDAPVSTPVRTMPDPLIDLWTGSGPPDVAGTHTMREWAEVFVDNGWSVIPMDPQKHPHIKWKPYQTRLPTTAEIRQWYTQWPNAGIGLVLGPLSGVFVIDVDGPEAHQALLQHLGEIPAVPLAVSGSRAPYRYHLYFRHPGFETRAKATPWHPKLEFRGSGGLVVLPPSLHKSGRQYAWAPGRSAFEIRRAEVPAAVLEALMGRPPAAPAAPTPPPSKPVVAEVTMPGTLHGEVAPSTREFLAGKYSEATGWNQRLFRAACDLHARGVSQEQAEPLLLAGAKPWNDAEKQIALATIASAFSEPRQRSKY